MLFSDDGATIDEVIARLLGGRTIATAESCTGGLMAGRLTDLAGSSAYVLGGLVVYSNEAKTALAGVPASLIEAHGAVSPEVATALSAGARSRLGADYRDRHHRHRRPGRRLRGEAGRHRLHLGLERRRTPRSASSGSRAAAPTSATARPPSPSTCSGRCCCAHDRRDVTRRCGCSSRSTCPTDVRDALAAVGAAADPAVWRPVAPEALHVTLAFLGSRPPEDVDAIAPIVAAEHATRRASRSATSCCSRRAAPAS